MIWMVGKNFDAYPRFASDSAINNTVRVKIGYTIDGKDGVV